MRDDILLRSLGLTMLKQMSAKKGYIDRSILPYIKSLMKSDDYSFLEKDDGDDILKINYVNKQDKVIEGEYFTYLKSTDNDVEFSIDDTVKEEFKIKKTIDSIWEKLYTDSDSLSEEGRFELLKEGVLVYRDRVSTIDEFITKLKPLRDHIEIQGSPDYFLSYLDSVLKKNDIAKDIIAINKSLMVNTIETEKVSRYYNYHVILHGIDKTIYESVKIDKQDFHISYKKDFNEKDFNKADIIILPESKKDLAKKIKKVVFFHSDETDFEKFKISKEEDLIKLIEKLGSDEYEKYLIKQITKDDIWYSDLIGKEFFMERESDLYGRLTTYGNFDDNGLIQDLDVLKIDKEFKGITTHKLIKTKHTKPAPKIKEEELLKNMPLEKSNMNTIVKYLDENEDSIEGETNKELIKKFKLYIKQKIEDTDII